MLKPIHWHSPDSSCQQVNTLKQRVLCIIQGVQTQCQMCKELSHYPSPLTFCCWLTWNLVVRGDSMWYGRGQQSWAAALGCPHRNGPGADRPITFSLGKQKEPWNFVRKYLGKYMRQPWEWDLSLRNMNMIMDIQEPILKKCSNNAKVCVFF